MKTPSVLYYPGEDEPTPESAAYQMNTDTFAVGDMSLAAYGYLAGYPLVGIEKRADGYTVFHFTPADARAMSASYRNPQTTVALQAYLAALKYLQTLRADLRAGTSQWAEPGASL